MVLLKAVFFIVYFENVSLQKFEPVVLVHGGAGNIDNESASAKMKGVKAAARIGYEALQQSGSVLDAVEHAVRLLELDPDFNAGYGSALTWEGEVEMDAAIMHGGNLDAGCVSLARDIFHPISLARRIMEKTNHRYLAGNGARDFASKQGFLILPKDALVTPKSLKALHDYKNNLNCISSFSPIARMPLGSCEFGEMGTVGAVAIDAIGNVAAATSTGGITGKMRGRIGDSPILGGGTYADNSAGSVSATGHGETIMRYNVASRILAQIEHYDMSAQEATEKVLTDMTTLFNQTAGVISIDKNGSVGVYFTSNRMPWAYQRGPELHYGVDKNKEIFEIVKGEPIVDF